jgi:hypothetical protein
MEAAVKSLRGSRDPLIAYLARHLEALAQALASRPDEIHAIGPLTPRERAIVPLADYLSRFSAAEGAIALRMRVTWTQEDSTVSRLTSSGFLQMLAAIAKGPAVQVPARQAEQELFLERLILDLNQQAGGVIPRDEVLAALGRDFRDRYVGDRLVSAVQAMADEGGRYDFVPSDRLDDFERWVGSAFIPARPSDTDVVAIRYGETVVVTTTHDLIWVCLRLFAGDDSQDGAMQADAARRTRLARDIMRFVEAQVLVRAVDRLLGQLSTAPGEGEIGLGNVRTGGLLLSFLDGAPGVIRRKPVPVWTTLAVKVEDVARLSTWLRRKGESVAGSVRP